MEEILECIMFEYRFGYNSFDTLIFIRKLYSKIVSV